MYLIIIIIDIHNIGNLLIKMEKIKIVFYSHTIDFAGTWRSHERVLLNLDKNIFQPYVLYRPYADNNRIEYVKQKLGEEFVIPFEASREKTGPNQGYSFIQSNFKEKINKIKPHIIHFARSGYYEWPFVERLCPVQMETNIFGFKDNSKYLDYSVTISDRTTSLRGGSNIRIYNPIPLPINSEENLKKELGIEEDYVIFGRIGRKDNFHPIALNCLNKLKNKNIKFKYIIIGACNSTISTINRLNLQNECIVIETTNDDFYIDKFHNTIDIFLHYRSDGETFGTAIAQSMMYGNPIISHYAGYNAQSEIIGDGGFVAKNEDEYFNEIIKLIEDKKYFNSISDNGKKISLKFEEKLITKQFENLYLELYNNINK